MSEKSMSNQSTSALAPPHAELMSLPGQIVHATWGLTMERNQFAVILKETPKTAILARLATQRRPESLGRGYERPLLLNGQLAIDNLLAISRIRGSAVAHFRLDPRLFDAIASSDARHIVGDPLPGDAFVEVFRVKVVADDGSINLPHSRDFCTYSIWDGREKFYDTND